MDRCAIEACRAAVVVQRRIFVVWWSGAADDPKSPAWRGGRVIPSRVQSGPSSLASPSWPGLSGPPFAARAGGGGPDKPGHDGLWREPLSTRTGLITTTAIDNRRVRVSGSRPNRRRVPPMNPDNRRDNCVAGVCAVIDRIENGGNTGVTANTIEAEFGSTRAPRSGTGSNRAVATPSLALDYIRKATGLPVSSTNPIQGGLPAARVTGHYALFVNDAHVVYARVLPFGSSFRAVVYDPQIARGFPSQKAYELFLGQFNQGTKAKIDAYYLGPVAPQ